ncbi:family 2 glycosyl transferase [Nitritalea halalkaliphila LW7]|uniref:Family 2 glycosyl transferase n=1 Tax=Nitritalea halalkaliphila LW7 TaxID=1189621 RepID=I5C1P6_9BACT|nr:glycosyltransferase [Nitritalea halalkaliphila]EIM75748.1 family 2 glycosyl transferase [Nitritalea halalkaliphila LW7]
MSVYLSLLLLGLVLLQYLWLLFRLQRHFRVHVTQKKPDAALPEVSLLLPARNEEQMLPACLEALDRLDYPLDKLQILLGNDNSTDRTGAMMEAWAATRPHVQVVHVPAYTVEGAFQNGKAAALATMARQAKGDVYLFTDADCQVPPTWARHMVLGLRQSAAGYLTGVTRVRPNGLWARLQGVDWWLTLGFMKVLDDLSISITSMGNNMAITADAYKRVGGFEKVKFALTEDFAVAAAIRQAGYAGRHEVQPEVCIETAPKPGFFSLLRQRKRWMSGAIGLPFYWLALLGLQVLYYPAWLVLLFFHPALALGIGGLSSCFKAIFSAPLPGGRALYCRLST